MGTSTRAALAGALALAVAGGAWLAARERARTPFEREVERLRALAAHFEQEVVIEPYGLRTRAPRKARCALTAEGVTGCVLDDTRVTWKLTRVPRTGSIERAVQRDLAYRDSKDGGGETTTVVGRATLAGFDGVLTHSLNLRGASSIWRYQGWLDRPSGRLELEATATQHVADEKDPALALLLATEPADGGTGPAERWPPAEELRARAAKRAARQAFDEAGADPGEWLRTVEVLEARGEVDEGVEQLLASRLAELARRPAADPERTKLDGVRAALAFERTNPARAERLLEALAGGLPREDVSPGALTFRVRVATNLARLGAPAELDALASALEAVSPWPLFGIRYDPIEALSAYVERRAVARLFEVWFSGPLAEGVPPQHRDPGVLRMARLVGRVVPHAAGARAFARRRLADETPFGDAVWTGTLRFETPEGLEVTRFSVESSLPVETRVAAVRGDLFAAHLAERYGPFDPLAPRASRSAARRAMGARLEGPRVP